MQTPKVSIGMPVYNGEKYLRAAINSLLEQDYTDFELIIADNASTDATEEICQEFVRRDARIRYYRNPLNIGAAGNFQLVLSLAQGEFFKWACHDDLHAPTFLSRCLEVFSDAPPSVGLVAPRTSIIDEKGNPRIEGNLWLVERLSTRARRPYQRLAEVMPRFRFASAQFGLFRTSTLRRTRGIDAFSAADRVLLAEVAMLGEIWEVDEFLFAYREHAEKSNKVNKTDELYAKWLNPLQPRKRPLLFAEYARSIKRLPLSGLERVLCLGVVARISLARKIKRGLAKIK